MAIRTKNRFPKGCLEAPMPQLRYIPVENVKAHGGGARLLIRKAFQAHESGWKRHIADRSRGNY